MAKVSPDRPSLANEIGAGGGAAPPAGGGMVPEPGCGDFNLRIGRDGTWYYRGSPIGRKPLVRLFATVLSRDAAGDYWLVTPVERGRIVVEDAPFIAVELTAEGAGRGQSLRFRTNLDEQVTAGTDHPIRVAHDAETGRPRPYILVRPGLEALILRAVFYQLVALGEPAEDGGDDVLGVWSQGVFFALGRIESSEQGEAGASG